MAVKETVFGRVMRLLPFLLVAMLTNYLAQLEHLNSDEVPGWTWVGWSRFFGYIGLAGAYIWMRATPKPKGLEELKQNEKVTDINGARGGVAATPGLSDSPANAPGV